MTPEEWKERVGSLLQRARKSRNLSIRKAAKAAGIDDGTWRHIEEGERTIRGEKVPASPRDETLAAVARAVGLDPATLFEAAGREYIAPIGPTLSIDERLAALEQRLGVTPVADGRSIEERLDELERHYAEGRSNAH